jgi:uncharacterized membrane protein
MKGSDLSEGENNLKIQLIYKDKKGRTYSESKFVNIRLAGLNLAQMIIVSGKRLARWALSDKGFIEFIVIMIVVFGMIIILAFRKGKSNKDEIEDFEKKIDFNEK